MNKNKASTTKYSLIVYQTKSGALELRGDLENDTIWASLSQIAELFGTQKAAISKHLKNIYISKEIDKKSTVSILETVQKEGKRKVLRKIEYYNLDAILSVGYRVNSKQATNFRRWASCTLKKYLVDGYALNKKLIINNHKKFNEALEKIKGLLPEETANEVNTVLELVATFADTWFSLDSFDKENFPEKGITVKKVKLRAEDLRTALERLKENLISKNQATELFSKELKKDGLESIIGNVFQSFGGQEVYPSLEEKAANILYLIIKNHPFIDGNKRSGAFAFIWFLKTFNILPKNLRSEALTAITLLVAISDAKEKDKMIGLILLLLNKSVR